MLLKEQNNILNKFEEKEEQKRETQRKMLKEGQKANIIGKRNRGFFRLMKILRFGVSALYEKRYYSYHDLIKTDLIRIT